MEGLSTGFPSSPFECVVIADNRPGIPVLQVASTKVCGRLDPRRHPIRVLHVSREALQRDSCQLPMQSGSQYTF
jgi:hypothetical protein